MVDAGDTVTRQLLVDGQGTDVVDRPSRGAHDSAVPDVQTLIKRHRDLTGDSYRDMARRIDDRINHTQLAKWAEQGPRSFPREAATVVDLAELLRVPVDLVVLGFARSLGLEVGSSQGPTSVLPGIEQLTTPQRRAVLSVVDAILDAAAGADVEDDPSVIELRAARRVSEPKRRDQVEHTDE